MWKLVFPSCKWNIFAIFKATRLQMLQSRDCWFIQSGWVGAIKWFSYTEKKKISRSITWKELVPLNELKPGQTAYISPTMPSFTYRKCCRCNKHAKLHSEFLIIHYLDKCPRWVSGDEHRFLMPFSYVYSLTLLLNWLIPTVLTCWLSHTVTHLSTSAGTGRHRPFGPRGQLGPWGPGTRHLLSVWLMLGHQIGTTWGRRRGLVWITACLCLRDPSCGSMCTFMFTVFPVIRHPPRSCSFPTTTCTGFVSLEWTNQPWSRAPTRWNVLPRPD